MIILQKMDRARFDTRSDAAGKTSGPASEGERLYRFAPPLQPALAAAMGVRTAGESFK